MNKVTFLVQQTTGAGRVAGFSETWYYEGTAADTNRAADNFAKRRSGFLTRTAAVIGWRIQVIGGSAQVVKTRYPGVLATGADIPQMAVSCKCKGSGVPNVKRFQVRGVPDSNVVNGDFEPTQAFQAAFDAWAGTLGLWRFRAKDLAAPRVRIVSIAADGTFALAGAITFNVGSTIDILRCKNNAGVNVSGSYYVSVKTDGQNGKFLNWGGSVVALKGEARAQTITYPLVDNQTVVLEKVTTRKVGRPFDLYAGRRQNR